MRAVHSTSIAPRRDLHRHRRARAGGQERTDAGLSALAFHYGRYLLIASSHPDGLPITLQGLWNAELPGPWSSAYTININPQMAYWPAETTGLPSVTSRSSNSSGGSRRRPARVCRA